MAPQSRPSESLALNLSWRRHAARSRSATRRSSSSPMRGVLFHHGSEPGHGHYEQLALFQRGGICRAGSPVDGGELSENGTGVEHVQDDLGGLKGRSIEDLHDALQHDQHLGIGVVALPEAGVSPPCMGCRRPAARSVARSSSGEPFEEADMGVVHAGGLVQLTPSGAARTSFPRCPVPPTSG